MKSPKSQLPFPFSDAIRQKKKKLFEQNTQSVCLSFRSPRVRVLAERQADTFLKCLFHIVFELIQLRAEVERLPPVLFLPLRIDE